MKVLIAGWFSFEQMGATAGDILSRNLVCQWLQQAHIPFDVAVASPFEDGIKWQDATPTSYSHVIFVCGPFGNGWPLTEFLETFTGCHLIGLNLSMLESLDRYNPFDFLLERDSSRRSFPDLSFLSQQEKVPIVGVILMHPQNEYDQRGRHDEVHEAIYRLQQTREAAFVPIDTRLDENATGLRTAAEVESLIARMDFVITTRLHGMVLALKNGVPALVVDPIIGGAKISRQAKTIGWPMVLTSDATTHENLVKAFDYCLTKTAREAARLCAARATDILGKIQHIFIRALPQISQTTKV